MSEQIEDFSTCETCVGGYMLKIIKQMQIRWNVEIRKSIHFLQDIKRRSSAGGQGKWPYTCPAGLYNILYQHLIKLIYDIL